jgi:hypothetical protein
MPNWCSNTLFVEGKGVKDFADKCLFDGEFTFELLYPTPQELLDQTSPNMYRGDDDDERKAHEQRVKELTDKYGFGDWYHWRINNWGTKWNAADSYVSSNDDNSFIVSFESAWSPPCGWLQRVAPMFPELSFRLEYMEEGMGFCGVATWDDYHGYHDHDGELSYVDEDSDREVEWSSKHEKYIYVDNKEVIDDDDFIPLPVNSLTK